MLTWVRGLIRLFFRLLYNELAGTYDLVSRTVSLGQWRHWQRAGVARLRGRQVLEVAHGTGDMLVDLSALGFQPVGLDLSLNMGRIAQAKLRRHGLHWSVPLVRGLAQALPFIDRSFPSILATFPAEFIIEPETLGEFRRVLRPGGVVVFVPVAQITGLSLPERFFEWLFRVTGQASTDWFLPVIDRYARAGFKAHVERVTLPHSVVTVVVAEKDRQAE